MAKQERAAGQDSPVVDDVGQEQSGAVEEYITVADIPRGLYDHGGHERVRDRRRRRYHPFAYDFDSTPMSLDDPDEHWAEDVKALHLANREKEIERLKFEFGE